MNGNKESLEELITNLNTAQLSEHTGERTHTCSCAGEGLWLVVRDDDLNRSTCSSDDAGDIGGHVIERVA